MVQKTDNLETVGVSAAAIRQILSEWKIPKNLIETPEDYTDPIVGDMVFVEGGSFMMGSDDEKPQHEVTLSSFYIGRYEITQAQWKTVIDGKNSSRHKCKDCPVENVSWIQIQEFIQKLNQQSPYTYRLPTEAEWEYAAKGGKQKDAYEYSGSDDVEKVAWYRKNSGGKTHPVGQKAANSLGIYDMSGNVWEWCYDWYASYTDEAQTDPQGPPSGNYRVVRGGYCNDCGASYVRVAHRGLGYPYERSRYIGSASC